jgi:hypothetical protein
MVFTESGEGFVRVGDAMINVFDDNEENHAGTWRKSSLDGRGSS